MTVTLSHVELVVVLGALEIPRSVRVTLNEARSAGPFTKIELSDEEADEVREQAITKLQTHGFYVDDRPNALGIVLESLIDKFFVE